MRKIHVLGTGCPKCNQLEMNVRVAASSRSEQVIVSKVTEIKEILEFGVRITPALVLDGKVVSRGKLLDVNEITALLDAPIAEGD
ncbi:thioredoxin family protein [bacterium]|nr:thioredoxin family protein [bacterium]